jgi:hypothetical protein
MGKILPKIRHIMDTKRKGYQFHHTMLDSKSVIARVSRIIALGIQIAILPLQERTDEPMISED